MQYIALIIIMVLIAHAAAPEAGGGAAGAPAPSAVTVSLEQQIEQYFIELAPFATVNNIITEENQKQVFDWLQNQHELTSRNKKALINLALGINPKTGVQSGFVSVRAIELLYSVLTTQSVVKTTLEWMIAVLSDPQTGFNIWKNKPELVNIYKQFPLLSLFVLTFIDPQCHQVQGNKDRLENLVQTKRKEIEKEINKKQLGSDFHKRLRQFGNGIHYFDLACLIQKGDVQTDLEGKQIKTDAEKYAAVERCFRLSIQSDKSPEAYNNLGNLICNGDVETDLNGMPITGDVERYVAAAECYRCAIQKGQRPQGYNNLGALIEDHNISFDENNAPVTDREIVVKRLYEQAGEYGKINLARLYLKCDFGLTSTERLAKIKELLEGDREGIYILFRAYYLFASKKESDMIKVLAKDGCSLKELELAAPLQSDVEEDDSLSDAEPEDASCIDDRVTTATPLSTFEGAVTELIAFEHHDRDQMIQGENNGFDIINRLLRKALEKRSVLEEREKKRQAQIKEYLKPIIINSSKPKRLVRFTEQAFEHFQALDQTGRDRFSTLIQAIENGEATGDEEMLSHEDHVDGKPVMTRRMTQANRLAYTDKDNVITILSLEGHYEARAAVVPRATRAKAGGGASAGGFKNGERGG